MPSVGILGCGQIGQSILSTLARHPIEGISVELICCRPRQEELAKNLCPKADIIHQWADYVGPALDIVVEAAGQPAAVENGEAILSSGSDLYLLSVGALADPSVQERLVRASKLGNSQIVIPAGALAGFDGLHTLRHSGLESVTYRSTKPPAAWKGTRAETMVDLENLNGSVTFFRGTASQAALQYPRNANLAAAVALAGIGLEKTQVELVADSAALGNTGHIIAVGRDGSLEVKMAGRGFAGNPKSSQSTSMSVVAALQSRAARITFTS